MIEQPVRRYLRRHRLLAGLEGTPLLVAVSGGPDSLALLHLLRTLAPDLGLTLHAAHLDHGMRGAAAAADAAWVAATCAAWGIPATVRAADVPAFAVQHRLSPEDAARRVRYAFLYGAARAAGAGAVAVGHNADDQVETVLLRLLRGTGPRGLAGMRPRRPFAPDPLAVPLLAAWGFPAAGEPLRLVRPLLATWRSSIEAYCAAHDLHPRHDATNDDPAYTRNRIRRDVVPLLETVAPGARRHLHHLAERVAAYDDEIAQQLAAVWLDLHQEGRLDLARFARLPEAVQERALLRLYATIAGTGAGLTRAHLHAAHALAGPRGTPGRWVQWPGGVALVREYGTLDLVRFDPQTGALDLTGDAARYPLLPARGAWPVAGGASLRLGPWSLHTTVQPLPTAAAAPDPWTARFDWEALCRSVVPPGVLPLVLRTRQPGERMHPLGMDGRSRRLQDVLAEAQVPRRLRDYLALLALPDGEVLWVPGPGGRQSNLGKITPATRQALILRFVRD
jgi:tRNA(Ile)-lysidine synthetase-like protein